MPSARPTAHSLRARPPPAPPPAPAGAADVEKERLADEHLDIPVLAVDRGILRRIVESEMGVKVERVEFLGSGTFHKCFLVTLKDKPPVVARIAQPYFPALKTSSEVATLSFLAAHTSVPCPVIHAYDTTTDNGLRAEYTLESLAPGVQLSSLDPASLEQGTKEALMGNLARVLVPVLRHRFPAIGSLYFADEEAGGAGEVSLQGEGKYRVGPIVSWPFFGNGRGFREVDRGPWKSEREYLDACVRREVDEIRSEGLGSHRGSSGSASASSPEGEDDDELPSPVVDSEEEEEEEEDDDDGSDVSLGSGYNPHELMYKAYRQQQSLLVTPFRRLSAGGPAKSRLELCEEEMGRWRAQMEAFGVGLEDGEGFALDLHDLRAENIFVDPEEPSRITCIIDFESTTLRPLSQASHLPALLLPPPQGLPSYQPPNSTTTVIGAPQTRSPWATPELQEAYRRAAGAVDPGWARREREGKRGRIAHRAVEWDGWEPGMVDHVLGAVRGM
ncbi:hypothetical protein CALVIDRAFT_596757 [Calocera viscosa TUFC12733]|uniref:Altered inheritance of mitochondria protein 9, mitochondrial n=1 Tax=Calocera viscosa (strain TUFC12733) TaxID=1330018 RepID=A0A167PDK8_CALVF|nr:hypothetical protein CALVIDRAFT_596757 [Calocera viscosa TUFC12733]